MTSTFDLFESAGRSFLDEAMAREASAAKAREKGDNATCAQETRQADGLRRNADGLLETARILREGQTTPPRAEEMGPQPGFLPAAA